MVFISDPRIYVFIPQASVLPKVAMVLTIAVGARLTRGEGEKRRETEGFKSQRTGTKTLCWDALHHATVPWSSLLSVLCLVKLKILTHVCFRYLIPNGKTNVPEGLPPPAEAYYKQNTLGSKSDSDKLICNTSNAF